MSSAPDEEIAHLGSVLSALGPTLMVLDNLEQIAVNAGRDYPIVDGCTESTVSGDLPSPYGVP